MDFLHGHDPDGARRTFLQEGCVLIESAYAIDLCEEMKGFIDSYASDDAEIRYKGTELRIFDAQTKNTMLAEFYQRCHETVAKLFAPPPRPNTLLAIRNSAIDAMDLEVQFGRWHLDSFFRQVKVFLFLTDTSEESGAFEFVPGSHLERFKYMQLLKGNYVTLADLFHKHRAYQKLDEDLIRDLSTRGFRARPVICRAGTVMVVNTSAIHRARPCLRGSRYALTTYYH